MSANSDLTNAKDSALSLNYADAAPSIMIVDDDDDIRLLLSQLLRGKGYNVIEAGTAQDAEANALKYSPHLILMDLSMPGTDGLSAIWNIRKQPHMVTVPIIIVSAYDAFDLRAEAAAAGCCGYLTKPLDTTQLNTMIESTLESTY